MSVGLGNHLLFGALQGLRVVERPRSGGPLRRVDGPRPAAEPVAAPAAAPATERVSLSAEALRLSRQGTPAVEILDSADSAPALDALTRQALRAYADHARS